MVSTKAAFTVLGIKFPWGWIFPYGSYAGNRDCPFPYTRRERRSIMEGLPTRDILVLRAFGSGLSHPNLLTDVMIKGIDMNSNSLFVRDDQDAQLQSITFIPGFDRVPSIKEWVLEGNYRLNAPQDMAFVHVLDNNLVLQAEPAECRIGHIDLSGADLRNLDRARVEQSIVNTFVPIPNNGFANHLTPIAHITTRYRRDNMLVRNRGIFRVIAYQITPRAIDGRAAAIPRAAQRYPNFADGLFSYFKPDSCPHVRVATFRKKLGQRLELPRTVHVPAFAVGDLEDLDEVENTVPLTQKTEGEKANEASFKKRLPGT